MENLNHFHPNIKVKHERSTESIPFLDLSVKLSQGKLETDLQIKPTDRHQYLHYSPSHSGHTKRSIVYCQTLRVSRICYHEADFRKHTTEMKSWFLKRSYPNDVIQKKMKKVKFSKIPSARKGQHKRCTIGSNLSSWFEKYRPNCQQKFTPSLYGSRS